jgi:hypothetical protein
LFVIAPPDGFAINSSVACQRQPLGQNFQQSVSSFKETAHSTGFENFSIILLVSSGSFQSHPLAARNGCCHFKARSPTPHTSSLQCCFVGLALHQIEIQLCPN